MAGRMSRGKGQRGERELATEITRLFGVEAHRGRQYHGGQDAPDVKAAIHGVHWECKRTEGVSVYAAIEQSKRDAGENLPVVAHRRNNKPWVFCCYMDDLPRLVTKLYLTMVEHA